MAAASLSGEPSPPSPAESSFRELEDVFLQSQTRIWIGEVLHERLDEQQNVSDLLADGDLLFEVSKVLWEMLKASYFVRRHIKVDRCKPLTLRKSIGRYAPYSNVDTFLKVCKILGLAGIDLFSPSDVVEKKDTRKVCMCIRSLSKKARSEGLRVPDFDSVTCTIAMPTDMVGGIRRSLELSQLNSRNSASHDSLNDSRAKCKQKISNAACCPNSDQHFLDSGDTESNYMMAQSSSPCTNLESSEIKDFSSAVIGSRYENGDNRKEDYALDECGSPCIDDSFESCFVYAVQQSPISNLTDDGADIIDTFLFDVEDSILKDMGSESDGSNSTLTTAKSGCELRLFDDAEDAEVLSMASINSVPSKVRKLSFEDRCNLQKELNDMGSESDGSNSTHTTAKSGCELRLFDSTGDAEVMSVASINSVSSKVQKLNFKDCCDLQNDLGDFQAQISEWQSGEADLMKKLVTIRGYEPQDMNTYEGTSVHNLTPKTEKPQLDMGFEDSGPSSIRFGSYLDWQSYASCNSDHVYDLENMDSDLHEAFFLDQSDSSVEFLKWVDKHRSAMEMVPNDDNPEASIEFVPRYSSNSKLLYHVPTSGEISQFRANPDVVIEDSEKCHNSSNTNDTCGLPHRNPEIHGNKLAPEKLCSPIEFLEVDPKDPNSHSEDPNGHSEDANRDDDRNPESSSMTVSVPNVKGTRGPKNTLLKVAASGTALFGLLFIFDQFRRRNVAERTHEASTQPGQTPKTKTIWSSKKGEGGRADSVYPAEKLKLRT